MVMFNKTNLKKTALTVALTRIKLYILEIILIKDNE